MPPNERPNSDSRGWVDDWQRKEREREQQLVLQKRTHLRFTLMILLGIPLLALLSCCGIWNLRTRNKDATSHRVPDQ